MANATSRLLFFLVCCFAVFSVISSVTDPRDAAAMRSLMDQWENTPPSWRESDDPCGTPWEGVTCNNSRITALGLSTMGLKGKLSGDIGGLTELRSLDLSFNPGLKGSLTPQLGDLQNLNILILAGCGFTGNIPEELGNLSELSFLALNSNNFSGRIPASLGNLSKVYWLDLADNQLTGPIPVSSPSSPGLDLLLKAKHFHFNKNQLSGPIPAKLFSSEMILIHVLFDGNQFSGNVPSTLGFVQTLEVLRLDRNMLSGEVPENLGNLTNINELNLAHNKLVGTLPDLSDMKSLNYVDLSNNSFDPSGAPFWFSSLPSLTTLVMEYGSLQGPVPQKLFGLPQIQQVKLKKNALNGTLSLGDTVGSQLELVDLQDNDISSVTLSSGYTNTLVLIGNPVCSTALSNTNYCQVQKQQDKRTYSTNLANCGSKSCPLDQKVSPQSCECAYPYEGTLYFRGPMFRDLSNVNTFHSLEMSLWVKLGLTPGSVSLQNPFFNNDDYLQIQLSLFPHMGKYFNRSEVQRIGFDLSNQTYKPPPGFGPYYFIASPYTFPAEGEGHSLSSQMIVGIITGCGALVMCLVGLGIYAVWQKRRAEKAIGLSRPFVSWASSGKDSGGAPQLKGARWFSYDELKKCTNNFSASNELGYGGYGKVYRGILQDGQIVAIKRAQQGSTQGGLEFKTEIELLSRVHHKNLVGLVGFCFEQGEQMLVYEFMPNGTLRDSLSGRSGIVLDWKRRLKVALGSARGLTYLHELADPPIIHRDVKSTNILLDENLTAKVADFGLSKLVSDCSKGHVSTQVKGTLGYLDPEYYTTQKLTEKSDVYSFGVVMLELITAKQPIEKGKYIVREVRLAVNKKDGEFCGLRDMMDHPLRDAGILPGFGRFLDLTLKCVEDSAAERPTMSDVVKEIEIIVQNDGSGTSSSASTSSSVTDFAAGQGGGKDLYGENMRRKEGGAFDYSGGYSVPPKIEPK
ncbi:PREDICTED: probable leucine-rich repeat receptor-like protein kinase At5g49770 [Tarenaya hassleriana]|uniref:probable leucine-rich repeat receptor-like protein kinase At5g49770 n=1 Tax=Tarenaya hassleriana TaxID=28532 RepID=UPI00053C88B2|nr:PREDICTED: probable leucine-rich repeat receptor-like protein kinase At5g49770 [Tarenaya hassleriana]